MYKCHKLPVEFSLSEKDLCVQESTCSQGSQERVNDNDIQMYVNLSQPVNNIIKYS